MPNVIGAALPDIYEIYADEAWTHGGQPLNRYWCLFGGIFGSEPALERLNTELKQIKASHGIKGEVKWTNVTAKNIVCCQDMIDCLFRHLRSSDIKYRQQFLDRALVRIPVPGEVPVTDLTVQFKLFYQFLKHAFGLRFMPTSQSGNITLLIRLDNHSSIKHKDDLSDFVEHLPTFWGRNDLNIKVSFINSAKHERLQICDLLMGAAGFHGNKIYKRRKPAQGGMPAQRGMTEKQKLKASLAKHVYNHLRKLDSECRGSQAFNWFETTGLKGNQNNRYEYKIRIWKFKPSQYQRDKGWENDHLDNQGMYVGPELVPVPTEDNEDVTY